jgi:hypothetical protein
MRIMGATKSIYAELSKSGYAATHDMGLMTL